MCTNNLVKVSRTVLYAVKSELFAGKIGNVLMCHHVDLDRQSPFNIQDMLLQQICNMAPVDELCQVVESL